MSAIAFASQGGEIMMAIRVMGSVFLAAATAIALVDPPANGASPAKVEDHTANLSGRSQELASIAMATDVGELAPNTLLCSGLLNGPRHWTYTKVTAVGE
jgi:hypothetical protein